MKNLFLILLFACGAQHASAFSLLGGFTAWQTPQLDYGWDLAGATHNLGGPMNLGEEHRWNVPTLYFGFDRSFLDYFGSRGVAEVEKAIQILNDLPNASEMNVDNFPLKTERINFRAQALGLLDLKSMALQSLVQEMGVADPQHYVFCLRSRFIIGPTTNYYVIKRNFDPVTFQPSSYINGDLWTYISILDSDVDTVVFNARVDPLSYGDPVSSDQSGLFSLFNVGSFYTGLTREDVGALRYIYHPLNKNVENAVTNAFAGGGGGVVAPGGIGVPSSPWSTPIFTTNVVVGGGGITNVTGGNTNFISTGLRSGVNKVRFIRRDYDSLLGQFIVPFVDSFTDTVFINNRPVTQVLQRVVSQPDILFSAADLFTGPTSLAFLMVDRTLGWANNGTLNRPTVVTGGTLPAGPGTINSPITITFNNGGPAFQNGPYPFFLSEANSSFRFPVWGSFDGTTNAPVVYPNNVTIEDLERKVFGGR